jgi:MtN3 and saliva related transmembrane protein
MAMTTDGWIVLLGSVGGFCTTFAYVPQVVKIWKQGGRDLSYGMLSLYLFGVLLWLAYGLLLHAQAVVLTILRQPFNCPGNRAEGVDRKTR